MAIPMSVPITRRHASALAALWVLAIALALALPLTAAAGQASSGELLFYPCTTCHPVTMIGDKPSRALPGGFQGHAVKLEGHDALGAGEAACIACHDDPAKDPGKLKLADGTTVDITGDVSKVCYRCHSAKYKEFVSGTHGRHQAKCTAAGCHDPHTPAYIFAPQLMPFVGVGFQFKALDEREPFTPLMAPPVDPGVVTPVWFSALSVIGIFVAGGFLGMLLKGRSQR